MKLLVLGGTMFLGRALVEAALARGDDVTTFTRGRTNPGLFPQVDRRVGDRDGGLVALEDGEWDAVVDTSGYLPRVVRASAELLRDRVERYLFVSSISVYADPSAPPSEQSALAELEDPASEEIMRDYGALKAACERAAAEVYGERALLVRPGLIVGPHDPTDRFTYWPRRVAAGGDVLAPGTPADPVQFIDVRDLAVWLLHALDAGLSGPYNATGEPLGIGELLEACKAVSGSDARFQWVPADRLRAEGVAPWTELPLWLPPEHAALNRSDVSKARAAGLELRPLSDTIRDTLAWDEEREIPRADDVGLAPERERKLLAVAA